MATMSDLAKGTVMVLTLLTPEFSPMKVLYHMDTSSRNPSSQEMLADQYMILPIPQLGEITIQHEEGNLKEMAIIEAGPLANYPHHRHTISLQAYLLPGLTQKGRIVEIIIDFLQLTPDNPERKLLTLRVQAALLVNNTKLIGKMDPYITFKSVTSHWQARTQPDEKGHTEPNFDKVIKIPFESIKEEIEIKVMDNNFIKDDIVGASTIVIYQLMGQNNSEKIIPIFNSRGKNGKIFCTLLDSPQFNGFRD